jgi:SpoVK/Ycf46/Vps4 family AAA+-type ATPase
VYVGIPEDKTVLLKALQRNFNLADDVITAVSSFIPQTMTGSDVAGLIRRAHLAAAKRVAARLTALTAGTKVSLIELHRFVSDADRVNRPLCPNHVWYDEKPQIRKCKECRGIAVNDSIVMKEDFEVSLTIEEIIEALRFVQPSITSSELKKYEELRDSHATVIG